MKNIILTIACLFALPAFAAYRPLTPCSTADLRNMEKDIDEWKMDDGFVQVFYIKNLDGKILGYFSTDLEQSIHASVCDPVYQDDYTSSNEWYYWDQERENVDPRTWKKDFTYRISQDEGIAYIKVLRADKKGQIKAELKLMGWKDDPKLITMRSSFVTFEERK